MSSRPTVSGHAVLDDEDPDRPSATSPKHPRVTRDVIALHVAVIAGLLAISVITWWRVWVTGHPTSTITCLCGDESGTLGILAWTPWALAHGHNPFLSNAIFAGQGGANMLTNTTWIAGSLLFSPVTWLFGPIATFNVAVTLAPVASGWCCFLAVRQFTRFVPGQIVAAVLYGFSPIIVALEPVGHLAQIWLIYPPLAFMCLYDLFVTQRHRPWFVGLCLGLLTVVQFFISTEVLAMSFLAGGIGMVVAVILAPRMTWARHRDILLGLTTAGGVVVVCLFYPAWFVLDGPRHIVGYAFPSTPQSGVPISGVVSAGPYVSQPEGLLKITGYSGNAGPDIAYLGLSTLAFLAISAIVWFKHRLAWILFAVGLSSWSFSLGTVRTWMPWRIFEHAPLVGEIAPGRFCTITGFAAALLLALSADSWWHVSVRHYEARDRQHAVRSTRSIRRTGAFLSAVTVTTLIPVGAAYSFPFVIQSQPMPPWFHRVAPHLMPGTVVLAYPYPGGLEQQAMAWQAVDGMRFRIVGGWGIVPGRDGRHSEAVSPFRGTVSVLDTLSDPSKTPLPSASSSTVREVRLSLRQWGVQVVVVPMAKEGRDAAYASGFFTAVFGRLPRIQDRAWVWYGLGNHPSVSINRSALFSCASPKMEKGDVPQCVLDGSHPRHSETP